MPIVLGHEAAGVVDAVGADVAGLAPGDPVVVTPLPPCGVCYWCVRGEPGVCVSVNDLMTSTFPDGSTGLSRAGDVVYRGVGVGAFAEYALTTANGAVRIPADVPLEVAFRTLRALRSADVQLAILKGGGHRLSEPHEIEAILRTVAGLLEPDA